MASAKLELVQSICSAWERGDYSSADWADPEIEFIAADGPLAGGSRGRAGMAAAFGEFLGAWEGMRQKPEDYRELDDERVLVSFRWDARGKHSNLDLGEVSPLGAGLFHVRDGRVVRFVGWMELSGALEELGLEPTVEEPAQAGPLAFDAAAAQQLEGLYRIEDAVRRRGLVRAALGARAGERVLDVGCGPGFYCVELAEEVGPSGGVVGIDPSGPMLELARRRCAGHANVDLREGHALSLPVEKGEFAGAICVQVLEYVRDVAAALAELRRALAPGGRVVVWDIDWATFSLRSEDPGRMERVLRAWDQHLVHPSLPRTLAPLLRSAGFDDVRMQAHPFATIELDPTRYYGAMAPDLIAPFVVGREGIDDREAQAWRAEQQELGERGEFYCAVTQFCFTATKRD